MRRMQGTLAAGTGHWAAWLWCGPGGAGRGGAGWAECSMYRNLTDQSSGVHCPARQQHGSDMETGSQVQDNG